jgi:hypothetical protein
MKSLSLNPSCDIFKAIAGAIWGRISRAHMVGVNLKEVGITADLVAEILWRYHKKGASIGVFVQESWNEKIYGSDLDVFIEVTKGQYAWFPMQAKLLKLNNIYDEIAIDPTATKQQWEKLLDLKKIATCYPFYLLYNGNNLLKNIPLDKCGSKVKGTQFGCSLVEPEKVAAIAISKHPKPPKFDDFHPHLAQPWKILTCCPMFNFGSTYTIADIDKAMRSRGDKYRKLASFGQMNDIPYDENTSEGNGIIIASREVGWDPSATFIIPLSTNR